MAFRSPISPIRDVRTWLRQNDRSGATHGRSGDEARTRDPAAAATRVPRERNGRHRNGARHAHALRRPLKRRSGEFQRRVDDFREDGIRSGQCVRARSSDAHRDVQQLSRRSGRDGSASAEHHRTRSGRRRARSCIDAANASTKHGEFNASMGHAQAVQSSIDRSTASRVTSLAARLWKTRRPART
jgi:hypothetical protein